MHHDLSRLDSVLGRYPGTEASLIMVLQDVQAEFGFLPCEALEQVAQRLSLPRTRVFSVATFFKAFNLEPQGKTLVQVCAGTACHVRGASLIEDELRRQLELPVDGTTADLRFSLKTVNCVGACGLAPVVITGQTYHADVKPSGVKRLLRRAEQAASEAPGLEPRPVTAPVPRLGSADALLASVAQAQQRRGALRQQVRVCGSTGCLAAGSKQVLGALRQAAADAGLELQAELSQCLEPQQQRLVSFTGCQRRCQEGPLIHVMPGDTLYAGVKPDDAAELVQALQQGVVLERLLGETRRRADHPFYKGQLLLALSTCGRVDPEDLTDYLAVGGFAGLARALVQLSPQQVLEAVERSRLRGRGGAGFATGRKWRTALGAAQRTGRAPYVLCNGDEGDPGAFMDRIIMEGSPFQVIEGMVLGAYALGAREGYIYVRHEYPLAVNRLHCALEQCRAAGLLGPQILGSELSFEIKISRGGGAFVCGESTALMRSIEGKVGEPRAKYVRSAERGLHDAPTVLNNVETWALVPGIVGTADGAERFAAVGTESSSGTKAFSLSGQVLRTGLVEVPMGTTLRQLIFDIGGGMPPGRSFKAVQSGGPSGGCLPAQQLDLPIDFDALAAAGAMMGSGGMIVMDQRTCMVDLARYFVDFLKGESCGKCPPCRLGLGQLSHLLRRITAGHGEAADLDTIEDVAQGMEQTALCGLGTSAPNPVLSTLRYFRAEYEAHLAGRCPAGVCKALIRYEITEACTGCLLCLKPCPTRAISGAKEQRHVIDQQLCTRCGICRSVCNQDAVAVLSGVGP